MRECTTTKCMQMKAVYEKTTTLLRSKTFYGMDAIFTALRTKPFIISCSTLNRVYKRFVTTENKHLKQSGSSVTIKISNSRPWARIKVFGVLPAHWMRALCWYPFHRWSIYSCVVTAQGGGRFWKIHTVKIAVHPAESCCTATTMALASIKQQISNSAWLRLQQSILLNFHPQPSVAHLEIFPCLMWGYKKQMWETIIFKLQLQ